ncbi:uncharacterized protein M421DRAFT_136699 [Didymella exigua CBS 183.55]|uniref:Uncharacterized protein n=1 Tax=Didymella exigua CBS 183.55 TaxID=1150837 RepID=A0A6A5RQK3_9PLEO|nr:uncharacterized protein M421DRAFT_136699 [Didymella exigua CBS 183.55]KAF1929334.1 hypothetical protein M421DRAFT_136699 [Didymella exigua CBS 183.55]
MSSVTLLQGRPHPDTVDPGSAHEDQCEATRPPHQAPRCCPCCCPCCCSCCCSCCCPCCCLRCCPCCCLRCSPCCCLRCCLRCTYYCAPLDALCRVQYVSVSACQRVHIMREAADARCSDADERAFRCTSLMSARTRHDSRRLGLSSASRNPMLALHTIP